MKNLIPEWCKHFDEFWSSVKKRNLFFIRLRYFAVFALLLFVFSSENIFLLKLTFVQKKYLLIIAFFLLFYNLLIHKLRNKIVNLSGFNPLHLSVIQITTDLILLTIILYLTGGIESPFLPFYIFHMIIGSLILPSCMVYLSAFIVITFVSTIAIGEYFGILKHFCIFGLYNMELYNHTSFLIVTLATFTITLFFSVFIANKIARELYLQEEHLINALEELKESNKRKHKYITGIMHEIKSPIAASQSITELILGGYLGELPENIRVKLAKISKRNSEAIEMINEILRISKINLLNEKEFEEVNPEELLEKELEKFTEQAESKNLILSKTESEGNPKKIKCDLNVLALALSNIIGNSVKYTPKGGKIEAKIIYKSEYFEIKICDSGKGIPKEEIDNIFIPFYRLKRDKGKTEGSGLGLALVKEIINSHNGEIIMQSPSHLGNKNNPGTCTTLKLPYNPENEFILNEKEINKI